MPVPGYAAEEEGPTTEAAKRAMSQLSALFVDAAEQGQLRRPLIHDVDDALLTCADDKHPELNGVLTPESFQAMLQAWACAARLHLARGLRPPRLAHAGGPRRAVPLPGRADRQDLRAARDRLSRRPPERPVRRRRRARTAARRVRRPAAAARPATVMVQRESTRSSTSSTGPVEAGELAGEVGRHAEPLVHRSQPERAVAARLAACPRRW